MSKRPTLKQLNERLGAMHAEGQGVWEVEFHSTTGFLTRCMLRPGLTAGEHTVREIFLQTLAAVHDAPKGKPLLCLTCDFAFGVGDISQMPGGIAILKPAHHAPTMGMVQGVCFGCIETRYPDDASLKAAIIAALGHYTGMETRQLTIAAAGHA
jgi:hypothetical protein